MILDCPSCKAPGPVAKVSGNGGPVINNACLRGGVAYEVRNRVTV